MAQGPGVSTGPGACQRSARHRARSAGAVSGAAGRAVSMISGAARPADTGRYQPIDRRRRWGRPLCLSVRHGHSSLSRPRPRLKQPPPAAAGRSHGIRESPRVSFPRPCRPDLPGTDVTEALCRDTAAIVTARRMGSTTSGTTAKCNGWVAPLHDKSQSNDRVDQTT